MVVRLQQYLSFQKKLSAVRDTFSSIMDEMLNIGIVLLLVCFFVGALNCLAFGLYDPAFQSFPQAFMEMLLLCFALYKPAASTPFVPSMFKYVPHTMSDVEYMKWVPLVLAVLFKTLVVLLLFKLLMGVIMEGYKKSNKARQSSHQVRDDLKELGRNVYHYVWGHLIRRKPYVSFFHVALAVATHEVDEDKPWEQYFLGLDHPHKIEKALNAVLDANQFPHMAAQIKQLRLPDGRKYEEAERNFVLKYYGIPYSRAETIFSMSFRADELKKLEKDFVKRKNTTGGESPAKGAAGKNAASFFAATEDQTLAIEMKLNQAKLDLIEKRGEYAEKGRFAKATDWKQIANKSPWNKKQMKAIFEDFDIMKLGTIRHIYMPLVFHALDIEIDRAKLCKMLAKHDDLDDGEMDFKEFMNFMNDKAIVDAKHKLDSHKDGKEDIQRTLGLAGFASSRASNQTSESQDGPEVPLLSAEAAQAREVPAPGRSKVAPSPFDSV